MKTPLPPLPRVCYEIFVRSFCDSNGDGIGDLNGIRSRLDYLQDLGVEAIWITPIHPSGTYHKYDVQDYYAIDPEYGTLDDFRSLLDEMHRRSMYLYMDLVINHSSSQHPWFQAARLSADNPYREYYWWMTQERIDQLGVATREDSADAHVLYPWHTNPGDPEKYYAMFWKEMPDLNYDSPALRKEIRDIVHFWLREVGVDGFRLDAARHIYPPWLNDRNPVFWEDFSKVVEEARPATYTVGEVWTKAEDVAPYFKGLKANFHFDLSYAIQKILLSEKDPGLVKALLRDYAEFGRYNPDFIDATLLTNHDQIRIGSIAAGNIDKMKLAAALLLTLPGQPYIYYGEEIGMLGLKPDKHIREPFLWNTNPRDRQHTRWLRPRYSRRTTVRPASVQAQDPDSLLTHYKSLITLRKQKVALGQIRRPNLKPVRGLGTSLIGYYRSHSREPLLILHNITAQAQTLQVHEKERPFSKVHFQTSPGCRLENGQITLPAYGSLILGRSLEA
jgi:alpha-amylase